MSWFESSANEAEADKEHYLMFLAVDFEFASGHAYFWSGVGEITFGGNTYLGMGTLASVSSTTDRVALSPETKTYRISGAEIDPAAVSEADIDSSFGKSVVEYFGFINPNTGKLLDTPEINFEGEISNIRRMDGAEPFIEVNAEDRMIMLERTDDWRFTHEHQQEWFPGDKGFDQMPAVATKESLWGGHRVLPGVADTGRGERQRHPDR